jgi:hypothetical protein
MLKMYRCGNLYLSDLYESKGRVVEAETETWFDARRCICKHCFKLGDCGELVEVA